MVVYCIRATWKRLCVLLSGKGIRIASGRKGFSEPRLTVPKNSLGFIADSLFSAMLIGSCRTKDRSLGFLKRQGGRRWWRECPRVRFVKEVVIAVQNIGHQDRTSLEIARSIEI